MVGDISMNRIYACIFSALLCLLCVSCDASVEEEKYRDLENRYRALENRCTDLKSRISELVRENDYIQNQVLRQERQVKFCKDLVNDSTCV